MQKENNKNNNSKPAFKKTSKPTVKINSLIAKTDKKQVNKVEEKKTDFQQKNFKGKKQFRSNNSDNRGDNKRFLYPFNKVLLIKKVDKVVSGGRNMSFVAVMVVGNLIDKVGIGMARGKTIIDAISHAKQKALNKIICPLNFDYLKYKHCATEVIMKKTNSNIIKSSNTLFYIFKACGIKNVSCKIVGSNNPMNCIFAVFNALKKNIQYKKNKEMLLNKLTNKNVK